MAAQKAGKRAKRGEAAPRKRAKKTEAAQWQRQLLLPNEDEPSAPLRAAATSARKRVPPRKEKDADARAQRAAEAAMALELAVSAPALDGAEQVAELPLAPEAQAELAEQNAADGGAAEAAELPLAPETKAELAEQNAADGGAAEAAELPLAPEAQAELAEQNAADGCESFSASATPRAATIAEGAHPDDAAEALASAAPLDAVERALLALEQRGGRAYDAISCDCARALLQRSQHASPRAAELLIARAGVHVQRLSDRFDRARAALEGRIAEAEQRLGALPDERGACVRGELVNAGRSLRRRACLPASLASRVRVPERFEPYQSAADEWVAVSALARAVDVVPEQAGPYNPLRIASDLLERIRAVSPTYLNAQLTRLEQLASMLALPELPEPAAKLAPRKR